jgi:hypothetical protein
VSPCVVSCATAASVPITSILQAQHSPWGQPFLAERDGNSASRCRGMKRYEYPSLLLRVACRPMDTSKKAAGQAAHDWPAAGAPCRLASGATALGMARIVRSPSAPHHLRRTGGRPTGALPRPACHPFLTFPFLLSQAKAELSSPPPVLRLTTFFERTGS